MHFIDSLFTVLKQETEPTGATFQLRLHADHPIYRGHFKDNPITPGVCSLEIMQELTAINYREFKRPTSIDSIKYLTFINPLQTSEVEVELKINESMQGSWRVRGIVRANGKPAVKMVTSYQTNVSNLKN